MVGDAVGEGVGDSERGGDRVLDAVGVRDRVAGWVRRGGGSGTPQYAVFVEPYLFSPQSTKWAARSPHRP